MIPLSINLNVVEEGDGAWPDLAEKGYKPGMITGVAPLANGTQSGKPTVAMRIELEDGTVVIAQTTMALFQAANRAFIAKFGEIEGV